MVEHMRTQSLITSQSVEAKLKQGSETAIPQRKPKEPSEQVKDVLALTHEPYKECEKRKPKYTSCVPKSTLSYKTLRQTQTPTVVATPQLLSSLQCQNKRNLFHPDS